MPWLCKVFKPDETDLDSPRDLAGLSLGHSSDRMGPIVVGKLVRERRRTVVSGLLKML